ncbi:MAG TPA: type I 3-dehydroquinate dehydratase, partial [Tepidisphaeraceae bacterium]
MTHLCVSIFVTDLAKAKRDITTAAEAGADMVELRVDGFSDGTLLESLIREAIMPVIVTCRPEWEGGHSQLGDVERSSILTHAADAGAHYVDLELATARRRPSELRHAVAGRINSRTKLILSTHHFTSRPSRLSNLVVELNQSLADIAKIVWLARTIRDNLEAFEILQTRVKPTIALCMGEAGLISRVLAKKFGGFLTFASLSTDSATAPGQISIHDLKHLYRWDAIQPTTRVYGVVGSPIMHSMSPAIHNAAFAETGIDAVYLPLLVNPGYESFKAFMESFLHFPALDLSGLSITIPHKENALRYLTDQGAVIEPLARRIGAVNT